MIHANDNLIVVNEDREDEWSGTWGDWIDLNMVPSTLSIEKALETTGSYSDSYGFNGVFTVRLSRLACRLHPTLVSPDGNGVLLPDGCPHAMDRQVIVHLQYSGRDNEDHKTALAAMLDYDDGRVVTHSSDIPWSATRDYLIQSRRCTLKRWRSFGYNPEVVNYYDVLSLVDTAKDDIVRMLSAER